MMKIFIINSCLLFSINAFSQSVDSIWSGNFEGLNYKEHYGDVRGVNVFIDSLKHKDSLSVIEFTIYGDSILPNYLLNFKNLKKIKILDFNQIQNIDILSQLPILEELIIRNSIFKKLPYGLSNLKSLMVNDFSFQKKIYLKIETKGIRDMKKLEELTLFNCGLNIIPNELTTLKSLTYLNLLENSIVDFNNFKNMTQLQSLSVELNPSTKKLPNEFSYLKNLKTIDIGTIYTINSKLNYKSLYQLPNLTQLILFSPEYFSDDYSINENKGLKRLKKQCPNIKILLK